MFERTGKVYKQGGLTMTIPQVYAEALGIKVGDEIQLSLDMDNGYFTVGKNVDKYKEVLNFIRNFTDEQLEDLVQFIKRK